MRTTLHRNKVLNTNVIGTSRVTAAALPFLRRSSNAAIVNTCSVVKEGIRVNCVNPSTTDTPWVGRLLSQAKDPSKERAVLESRQPIGRLVAPEEVANAIIYLAHPDQKSTTGTVLSVDGGLHSLYVPR